MFSAAEAETYDLIQESRGRNYRREAEFVHDLVGQLKPEGARTVLDLACGTGGHLPHLAERYAVQGLDSSEAMLEIARRRAPQLVLHRGDLVEFELPTRFDVVLCLFSSIAYATTFERFRQAVASIARHLAPGGVAVIEPWFSRLEYQADTVHAALVDRPLVKIARMNVSTIEDGVSVVTFHYMVGDRSGVKTFVERHEMGLFDRTDYERAFAAAGLRLSHQADGLSGRGIYIGLRPPAGPG
jgi:SAM-dependent methyltransferase